MLLSLLTIRKYDRMGLDSVLNKLVDIIITYWMQNSYVPWS